MGRDNHPKTRQLGRAVAKHKSAGYDRILIVTEGKKTEPQYFQEICSEYRLCSTNVAVQYCELGTAPIQVIEYARQLFEQGDRHKGIRPKSFDQIYAVFDRDEHHSYFEALTCAEKFNNTLKNDEKKIVLFKAIASVPSFELWLLLHYEDIQAPIQRAEVLKLLKRSIPDYEKNMRGTFDTSKEYLQIATQRADKLAGSFTAYSDTGPFTAIAELVKRLMTLRE